MWTEYFRLAFKTFWHQKKRTLLTLIGIFIGIAAVVSLISLGKGLQDNINRQFEMMGTDKVIISAGTSGGFSPTSIKLSRDDLEAVDSLSGVEESWGMVYKLGQVGFRDESAYTFVIGMDTKTAKTSAIEGFGTEVENGRDLKGDSDVLVGYRWWTGDFFDRPVRVGDRIDIEGKNYKVVGEVSKVGNPSDDGQIYITLESAQELLGFEKDEIDMIFTRIDMTEEPSDMADDITRRLRKTRDVKEDEEDFTVSTTEDYMEAFGTILLIVQIVLIGISSISLLVGGVNITNTIYTSVLERTNEIGIMKAIGARNSDIFFIFLVESGILGLVGGIIGLVIGVGMSEVVAFAAEAGGWGFIKAAFPPYLMFGALAFSFIVGAVAGAIPARQASKMKPVDALRYE